MQRIKRNIVPLSLMLSIPFVTILYRQLNNPSRGVHVLVMALDRSIPFVKAFIIPYLGFYPYVCLALFYLCFKDRRTYYKTLLSINIGMLVCFLVYYGFQTTVPRPIINGTGLLDSLVSFMYSTDHPYNAFPSLHVLISFLMIKAVNQCRSAGPVSKILVYCFSGLVIISTQFVKQHVILDAFSAILLGNLTYELVDYAAESDAVERIRNFISINLGRMAGYLSHRGEC